MATPTEARKPGRPGKNPNTPPMPKAWKSTERLAACLSYLEASEGGATTTLEQQGAENFAAQLQAVHDEVRKFEDSWHRFGKVTYHYSLEESKKRRPTVGGIVNTFT